MPLLFLASLFLAEPVPMEMPRAQAYRVEADGVYSLEDRYCAADLWTSRTVVGRWMDADGRAFVLSRLSALPPPGASGVVTRVDYSGSVSPLRRKDRRRLRETIAALSPVPIAEEGRPPRQLPRGYRDVDYWHGTNMNAIVCAFLPEPGETWFLATWSLVEGDNLYERIRVFEDDFLAREFPALRLPSPVDGSASEREQLRADAANSVALYPGWHVTHSTEFTLIDHVPAITGFAIAFTNELPRLRRRYAEVMPSPIDGSNVLCVARVFADREEFLDVADEGMAWSAAYWAPQRRELIAYLPDGGVAELMRTIRHEAFHQYLSYATSMIETSPWLNEGYAQYFEDEESTDWGLGHTLTLAEYERMSKLIPALLGMDYAHFYEGDSLERHLKYRLAWSIAVFLEKGAPKVRFEPFRNLKRDYVAALLAHCDPKAATAAAFAGDDKVRLFVAEWLKYWTD